VAVDRGAVDVEIARLARAQNGVVTREQLLAAGITSAAIKSRAGRGLLNRIHRGVYATAPPELLQLAPQTAALLSLGPHAILSHRSAAALWSLASPDPSVIDVTFTGEKARPRPGVRLHYATTLTARDTTSKFHLRLTTPARALIDFASHANASELEQALAEARAQRLLTDSELNAALARAPANHRGAALTRALLKRQTGRAVTQSKVERTMLALVEAAELPAPRVNVRLHGFTVDFLWPAHKLAVEVDGYRFHSSRPAFERDRYRDQVLAAAGLLVLRVTWLQLEHEPIAVIARLSQALARRAAAAA
jgi:very-short-patch-repair endonuclease